MRKAKKIRSLKSKINALMLKKVKKYVKNVISEAFNVIHDKNDFLEESTIKCFSWNVRTLSLIEDGYKSINSLHNDRFSLLAKDMRSKNIDIGGLQEVRRPNSGLDESGDYILYWSGLKNRDSKMFGVGIIIKKDFLNNIEIFNISERIMYISGFIGISKYFFFSVYGPTEKDDNEMKDLFYDSLNDCLSSLPKNSNIVIFGDFNARIGPYKSYQDNLRGKYLNDRMNVNGQNLLNLCAANNLIIANSYFDKSDYSSWFHPKTKVGYTIDFCILSTNLKYALKDSGVNYNLEFPDIDSDHYPVFMDLYISCSKCSNLYQKKFNLKKKMLN